MLKHLHIIIVAIFVVVTSCKKQTSAIDGYTKDVNGFYYKLVGIGEGNEHPRKNEVIVVEAVMKTLSDSVFWDTYHDAQNGLYIDLSLPLQRGSCDSYFTKAVEGDSVSFYINPTVFFKEFFGIDVPKFDKKDSLVKMDIKIIQVISKSEYHNLKKMSQVLGSEDRELQELQLIDAFLMKNYGEANPDGNGIYWLNKQETSGEDVSWGKKVQIEYEGFYLDGRPISVGKNVLEFMYGTPDQIITGLNIVIGSLKNGEIAKIILPSRLAFGEKGSTNASIKPYTPLVFELKITDVQTINP